MKYLSLLLFIGLLPMTIFSQTSYSWTGSTNTDWATSSNWSPSGVPSAGDAVSIASTANQPVLDMARSIGSLTMSASSTLSLGGYVLTVSGTGTFTSATVSNGELITGSFNASSSTFSADVTASGNSITTTSSNYQGKVSLNYTGSANVNSGGNTFEGVCHITQSGSGLFVFGQSNPDVFEDSLFAVSNGSSALVFGSSSTGNRFEGYTVFERGASATSTGIEVGNTGSTTSLTNQVKLSSSSAAAGTFSTLAIKFKDCLFDSTASLGIAASGFDLGQMSFLNTTISIPTALSLGGSSSFLIDDDSVFEDSLSLSASNLFIHQCELQGLSQFTKTGGGVDQSLGPFTASAAVHFKNTGSGYFYIEGDFADSYQDVTLENISTGNLAFCRRGSGNTIAGNLETIITNGTLSIGIETANRASLTGNIFINSTGGLLFFGGLNQQSGSSISYTNLGGGITFKNFNQQSSTAVHLVSTGSSNRITLGTGSSFSGKFKAEFPSIMIQGGTYADSLTLIKTGNITDQGSGNLTCYGPVSFKSTHSSGTWQINYSGAVCMYHDNVTYDRSGSGAFEFGYVGPHHFKKDLHITGTHTFGQTNNYFTFNGTGNQTISRGHSLASTFLRLEVDKPSGDLTIEMPITIAVNLNLQKGIIKPTAGNNFVASLNTSITGGSDSSYVDGFMAKYGSTAFTFPIGRNGHYKPLSISASGVNNTFKAMYANLDPQDEHSFSSKDGSINEISSNEYWKLERTFGSSNVEVSLYRDNMGCSYDTLDNLKITAYNGSTWKDLGNGGTSGNDSTGTITTNGVSTVYGMYTLATSDTFNCVPCRADAGEDTTVFQFSNFLIGSNQNYGEYYNWEPETHLITFDLKKVEYLAIHDEIVRINVKNIIGCIAKDEIQIDVDLDPTTKLIDLNCPVYD